MPTTPSAWRHPFCLIIFIGNGYVILDNGKTIPNFHINNFKLGVGKYHFIKRYTSEFSRPYFYFYEPS